MRPVAGLATIPKMLLATLACNVAVATSELLSSPYTYIVPAVAISR